MQKIIDANETFVKEYVDRKDAVKKFKAENEIYKVELLEVV